MKKLLLVCFIFVFFVAVYLYQSYLLKQRTITGLQNDVKKITVYSQWGYNVQAFEKMYNGLLGDAKSCPFPLFLFRTRSFQGMHDNILQLVQSGYATEVAKQKSEIQLQLTYLRERVKNDISLTQSKKSAYFDTFDVVAGNTFEKNTDISSLKKEIAILEEQDGKITKDIETIRKESLLSELQGYKTTCGDLLGYFTEKNSTNNEALARECITEADKLMGPGYSENGADFIETLSRERVFTYMQQATQAKQQIEQDELYAEATKKKEEEKLTVVPPAPRQEGKVVLVNIKLQRLYAYENGTSLFPAAVPITTGKQGFETVTGEFAIYLKERNHEMTSPFPGIYYDSIVNYWMPFYLGYGLHDAYWRTVYGTQDYGVVGSHGCVNIPLKETSILYNWAEVGTKVIVI